MRYSDTTVVLPVKDEPAAGSVAQEILEKLPGARLIVIYKGSNGSLSKLLGRSNVLMLKQRGNGKGAAVREALLHVNTSIFCLIDGDATYRVTDLRRVIALVRAGADMALGNRFGAISDDAMPAYVQLGNSVLTGTLNLLYGAKLHDSQSGLRAARLRAISKLHLAETGFGIESEMDAKASRAGLVVRETPIGYGTRVGNSKQMKLLDGVKLLLLSFKFLG